MKIKQYDNNLPRKILISLITDDQVLAKVSNKWEEINFESDWARQIAEWCVQYHQQYNRAPKQDIEGIFASWASEQRNASSVETIEKFLSGLSKEYKKEAVNSQFVLDKAAAYFQEVNIKQTVDKISGLIDRRKIADAGLAIEQFRQIDLKANDGIDPYTDEEIQEVFEETEEALISYPGALGEFFGDQLCRDGFISFFAPEKAGKTFWLTDMAERALMQRRRVALFQVGDLSKNQMKKRLYLRRTGHPLRSDNGKWPFDVKIPIEIERKRDEYDTPIVHYKERTFEKRASPKLIKEINEKFRKKYLRSKEPYLRLSVHSTSSINVQGIQEILNRWYRQDNWAPDVIVIDYADILSAPSNVKILDKRDIFNETWKQLRRLSQDQHCLVLTASQADAASYDTKLLTKKNFSEDKRKMAHATGVVGLNITSYEKDKGLCRLNWIVRREGSYSPRRCVNVAGCLSIGRPAIKSIWDNF